MTIKANEIEKCANMVTVKHMREIKASHSKGGSGKSKALKGGRR